MKAGKMNAYKKMVLFLLAGAAIGAVIGILGWMILSTGIAEGTGAAMLESFQQMMLPLMFLLAAAGFLIGEYSVWKMKNIGQRIVDTQDEECDRWEYEYEKTGAVGVISGLVTQALCVLVLSAGYSIKYIGTEESRSGNFLLVCLVFILYFMYADFWQVRYIKNLQKIYPEKKGDPVSRKFQKEWLASCDEAERVMIYQSAYRSYVTTGKVIPVLLLVTMLCHLFFDTGIMAVAVVAVVWMVVTGSYVGSCVKIRKEKLE